MKQPKLNQIQQGDVTLIRVESLPNGTHSIITTGHCVLAEGEHTGHAHTINNEDAELIRIGERMLLRLGSVATLTHQEHGPIILDPGIYEVGRISEYDYFAEMTRSVAD